MISLSFALLLLSLVLWALYMRRRRLAAPLPPGPPQLPFIGNVHQLPLVESFKTFTEWSKTYGPIIYFHTFGREFVVLNDLNSALDLFERRSSLYSTRPRLVMAGELVNKEQLSMVFSKYSPRLKECRRITHSWMGKGALRSTWQAQEMGAYRFAESLLESPARFSEHIRRQTGTVLLRLLYGIRCLPENDPHIANSERVCTLTAEAMMPGRWLCDSFPFLAYIPAWFPGASFQHWAAHARQATSDLIRGPYEAVRAKVLDGTATRSWVVDEILDESGQIKSGMRAHALMVAAGSLYAGGVDTSVGTMRTFFLMMARHPEIQRKVQAECDRVIGSQRLPGIADREAMPYLNCVMKEVLRLTAIIPLMPHSLDRDDVYEGYLIPKGAWVMVNVVGIFYDPKYYPNPHEFKPERFDSSLAGSDYAQPDPEILCFGLGRRSCTGAHFARTWLFLNMATVLSVFDILPAKGENPPEVKWDCGHIRVPSAFGCSIVPRSAQKVALVRQVIETNKED